MQINLAETVTDATQAARISSILTYVWHHDEIHQAALAHADGVAYDEGRDTATEAEVQAAFSHAQKFLDEVIGQLDEFVIAAADELS